MQLSILFCKLKRIRIIIHNGDPNHHVWTLVGDRGPVPCDPVIKAGGQQILHVALPGAEEVAGVVVRVGGLRPVVAVVTTSVISVTGIKTALEAGNRDQVVSGSTPTPAIQDFSN